MPRQTTKYEENLKQAKEQAQAQASTQNACIGREDSLGGPMLAVDRSYTLLERVRSKRSRLLERVSELTQLEKELMQGSIEEEYTRIKAYVDDLTNY